MDVSRAQKLTETLGSAHARDALRDSEQSLQDILDNTTAVVFVKDLGLRYILVNREYNGDIMCSGTKYGEKLTSKFIPTALLTRSGQTIGL